ncbi:hypothetical protein L484_002812 [Morus notabilis]|uniref:Uncharacterized protein n=1 Tax=Morus notabilis TaxID=981085 RepID=W9RZQ0_9ROSA|nr:hypothetical protein L484_002812 [Morus notabilis]
MVVQVWVVRNEVCRGVDEIDGGTTMRKLVWEGEAMIPEIYDDKVGVRRFGNGSAPTALDVGVAVDLRRRIFSLAAPSLPDDAVTAASPLVRAFCLMEWY